MEPIRLAGPADVLAVLPYQLGYHPSDSLVALALRDRQIGLVERIDLPPDDAVDVASAAVVPPLVREDPDGVLLVGYESTPGAALPLADAVRDDLVAAGVTVLDRLVVRDGRWYAPDCDTGCCPTVGAEQEVPRDSPAVAQFVALEVAPLPGRDSLAALVAADPALTAPVAAALATARTRADGRAFGEHAVAVHRLRYLATWAKLLDVSDRGDVGAEARPGREGDGRDGDDRGWVDEVLTPDEVALLVVSLRDIELRDGVIGWVCPGTLPLDAVSPDLGDALRSCLPPPAWGPGPSSQDGRRSPGGRPHGGRSARGRRSRARRGDGAEQCVVAGRRVLSRLQAVVRAVPDEDAAGVLTLLANLAWWLGDGALTRVALDRALEHSPGYRLARLLERMVDLGLRPRADLDPPRGPGSRSVTGGLTA